MLAYLRWGLQAPALLVFYVFCWATCWLWAGIAASFKLVRLPGPLCWVHTHDDTIYGNAWLRSNGFPAPASWWSRWITAMWWICRNPGYGFAAYVLGFPDSKLVTTDTVTSAWGPGKGDVRSFVVMTLADGGKRFSWRWQGRGIKVWLGWQPANQAGWHVMKFSVGPNPDD